MLKFPPTALRSLVSSRRILALLTVTLLAVVVPSASARRSVTHRHPRLHALAHAFVNATIPAAGLLPDDADDLPLEGLKYELKLAHTNTGEMVDVVYRIGDTYIPEALTQLDLFLRDSHNQEAISYDPRTFDLLHTMLAKLGRSNGVVDILSGYRSQETNDMLRASGTTNAAEHSQHISAKALDLRVLGVSASLLREAAQSIGVGGVGYYPSSQFVHVDTGPVRQWTFAPHMRRISPGHSHRHSRRSHRA